MTQERIIRAATRVPGGYTVQVEVTNAYTDGTSRFDELFVPVAAANPTADELVEAVSVAMDEDPFREVRSVDVLHWRKLRAVSQSPLADIKRAFDGG